MQEPQSLKPSDFTEQPFNSVAQKTEAEIVARNIMTILRRTDNTFREFLWEEYEEERLKDGNFTVGEHKWFDEVIGYFKTADTARLFSKQWAI